MPNTPDSIIVDDLQVQGDLTVAGSSTTTGTVEAEHLSSTDDAAIADDLSVGGDIAMTGSLTSTSGNITLTNGTVTAEQLTSTDDITATGRVTAGEGQFNASGGESLQINTVSGAFLYVPDNSSNRHGLFFATNAGYAGNAIDIWNTGVQACRIDATGNYASGSGNITLTNGTVSAEQITSTDDITATGTVTAADFVPSGTPYRADWISVNSMTSGTFSATLTSPYIFSELLSFAPGADNYSYFTHWLGNDYKAGTNVSTFLIWSNPTTDTGNVRWFIGYRQYPVGSVVAASAEVIVLSAGTGTAYGTQEVSMGSISGSSLTKGSIISGCVIRDADHADDTYTGDAHLLGIVIYYQIDTLLQT